MRIGFILMRGIVAGYLELTFDRTLLRGRVGERHRAVRVRLKGEGATSRLGQWRIVAGRAYLNLQRPCTNITDDDARARGGTRVAQPAIHGLRAYCYASAAGRRRGGGSERSGRGGCRSASSGCRCSGGRRRSPGCCRRRRTCCSCRCGRRAAGPGCSRSCGASRSSCCGRSTTRFRSRSE